MATAGLKSDGGLRRRRSPPGGRSGNRRRVHPATIPASRLNGRVLIPRDTMPVVTVADLLEELRRCRLLETTQLEETATTLQPDFAEPRPLAGELVRRGW